MSDLELCYLPATDAIARFKNKSLSPVELLQAYIERAEEVEPTINAFTFKYFDQAMQQAKKAEAKYSKGARTRALEGLPVCVKDESYIEGWPTSNGSLTMKDYVATTTSPINARILKAGGIVHARTATPEFSCAGYCHSKLWGVTRNPWNPAYTPGGSSGGSAASLAAGTCSLATGSDIGGSIRIPASASGVVGFKPPYGRVPQDPPFNLDFYCHSGPLARTVSDATLLQNVVSGPHPGDITSLRPKQRLPLKHRPIENWSIAFSMDLGFFEVDAEVQKNTFAALEVFRSLGATVHEVDLGWTQACLDASLQYLNHIFGASISPVLATQGDLLTDYARDFAERGTQSTSKDFLRTLEVAGEMYQSLGPVLEKHDILICPTNNLPAVKAEHNQARDQVLINGKQVDPMLGWVMTAPFNMMSRCPVISVPSGHNSQQVPTGIQIVGKTYRDQDVFRAAMAYEEAVGGWYGSNGKRPDL